MRAVNVTPEQLGFPHAAQVVEITRQSMCKKTETTATGRRLFVLSEALPPRDALLAGRAHWGVENKNHHPRDATWLEDKTRTTTGHTAANFALLRGVALIWWRKQHPNFSAPQFIERNRARRTAAIRKLYQPLTRKE